MKSITGEEINVACYYKDELFSRQWVIMERDISQIPLVQERQSMIK